MKTIRFLIIPAVIGMLFLTPLSALANSVVIDQSNGTLPSTSVSSAQILSNYKIGQTFVPSMPTLVGVDVGLYAVNPTGGNATITLNVRQGGIYGTIVASHSQVVASNNPNPANWVYFGFSSPVTVAVGNIYVIELISDTATHNWVLGAFYDQGFPIYDGILYPYPNARDFSFRTYGSGLVDIDIKPTSCPNPLNVKDKGVLPVAILGTEDFDVTTIDPETIRLEGVAPIRWAYEDIATPYEGEECGCNDLDGDGYLDLTLKFKTQEVVDHLGEVLNGDVLTLHLEGNLKVEFDGLPIVGNDCVVIKAPHTSSP
jgi:hypothetical protein